VFLAHVGSFVPADAATVGLTDRIFTRVATSESISAAVAQSSFMCDTHQMAVMLRHATPRSLLIVDEFGKGTLTVDGIGLLCACVNNLAECVAVRCHSASSMQHGCSVLTPGACFFRRRGEPPKAFVTTHFSEVLDEELVPRVPTLGFYTMNILGAADRSSRMQLGCA
jgi:DNA mismatch repair protein MSH5